MSSSLILLATAIMALTSTGIKLFGLDQHTALTLKCETEKAFSLKEAYSNYRVTIAESLLQSFEHRLIVCANICDSLTFLSAD